MPASQLAEKVLERFSSTLEKLTAQIEKQIDATNNLNLSMVVLTKDIEQIKIDQREIRESHENCLNERVINSDYRKEQSTQKTTLSYIVYLVWIVFGFAAGKFL